MSSLWEQAEAARDEAEKEHFRRLMEEHYRYKEENLKLSGELTANLTKPKVEKQDWNTIIREARNSGRHKVFYTGSSKDRQVLVQNNFTHLLSTKQIQWIKRC